MQRPPNLGQYGPIFSHSEPNHNRNRNCPVSNILHCILSFIPLSKNPSYALNLSRQTSLELTERERERERMAASEHTVLQFGTSSSTLTAKIHPLVIFNICDCYVRRPDQAERVIGTLLGSILPDGTVDIRNSYAVPHSESADQVFSFFRFLAIYWFLFGR